MAQIHVLCSDEPLLKNDRADEIIAQARAQMPDAQYVLLTAADLKNGNLAPLENELIDPGLFGGDRIIKIYLNDLNKGALDILDLLVARQRPGICAIVDLPRIEYSYSKIAPKKLSPGDGDFIALQKKKPLAARKKDCIACLKGTGGTLEYFYAPEAGELKGFVAARARRLGIELREDGTDYLCAAGEGNLTAIDQILRQIAAGADPKAKTAMGAAEISSFFGPDSRYFAADYADALFLGDERRAMNILGSLDDRSLIEDLGSIVRRLNSSVAAILRGREAGLQRAGAAERSAFFTKNGIRIRKSQDALMAAVRHMSPEQLGYVNSCTVNALHAIRGFETDRCILILQNLAASVRHRQALALDPGAEAAWE